MRVVVIGATGNCGSALLRTLESEPAVTSVLGIARRRPEEWRPAKVEWAEADIAVDDLVAPLQGADVVVHLAWLIQPSHDVELLDRVNVQGSARVFDAVVRAGVPSLVYASSVGAYAPAPVDGVRRDEGWPVGGIPPNDYSRQKAQVEAILDEFERRTPALRVVRMRPALVFQRAAATSIRRLFAGPLLPRWVLRGEGAPVAPDVLGLVTQCVHADDLADAYRRAIVDAAAHGPYNVAGEPVLDADAIRRGLGAPRSVPVPPAVARRAADVAWRAHLQPIPGDWVDLAFHSPLLDTTRLRGLGWVPQHESVAALRELVQGIGEGADHPTPPLDSRSGGPARLREVLTGIGSRDR